LYCVGVYLVLSQSRLTGGVKKAPRFQLFVACRRVHKERFLRIRKNILGGSTVEKKVGKYCRIVSARHERVVLGVRVSIWKERDRYSIS